MIPDRLTRYSTFSLIGYDPVEDRIGVGVQSKFFAVGASVPWVEPGVGAIATQAYTNLTYGIKGITLLEENVGVDDIMQALLEKDAEREKRQVAIMDTSGKEKLRENPAKRRYHSPGRVEAAEFLRRRVRWQIDGPYPESSGALPLEREPTGGRKGD